LEKSHELTRGGRSVFAKGGRAVALMKKEKGSGEILKRGKGGKKKHATMSEKRSRNIKKGGSWRSLRRTRGFGYENQRSPIKHSLNRKKIKEQKSWGVREERWR